MKKRRTDLRARMDVDAGGRVREFGHDAREQRHAELPQHVREPVVRDRQHAGIAQQDLVDAARGGIATKRRQNVGIEHGAQSRQFGREAAHQRDRVRLVALSAAGLPGIVAQLEKHLMQQCRQRGVERSADVEVFRVVPKAGRPEPHREERAAQRGHDLLDHGAGRQFAPAAVAAAVLAFSPAMAGGPQLGHDAVEIPVGRRSRPRRLGVAGRRHTAIPAVSQRPSKSTVLR